MSISDKLEKLSGVTEELSVMKERLYIALGDLEAASKELQNLIDAYPKTVRYLGMLAELLQANDFTEKSLEIYADILIIDPSEPRANIALAEHYRLQNDYANAFKYLSYCFDDKGFSIEVKFQILVSYFQLAVEDVSYLSSLYALLDKAIIHHPNEASFHALYGDMHYQKNNVFEARSLENLHFPCEIQCF